MTKYVKFWRLFPRSRQSWLKLLSSLVVLYLLTWYALPFAFPYRDQAWSGSESSKLVVDRNGIPLHHQAREDYFRLQKVTLDELPEHLIQATLAAEDKRFYSHGGVDFLATLRSIKDGIEAGEIVSGASTITQQTVKLSSAPARRTFKAKFIEAFTARHLELTTDKDTILTSYFNHLDYGNHMLGPKQAALHYFGKPLSQLSLAECALLAGIPQSPSRHDPRDNPQGAKKRRDWVLDRMQIVHHIPADEIIRAKNEPIILDAPQYLTNAPLIASMSPSHTGEIRTTIQSDLQNFCKEALHSEITKLEAKHVQNGAVIVIDNSTLEILALVGSHEYASSASGQINAATSPRSPGSVLKPLVYALAFDKLQLTPATIVPDVETIYSGNLGPEEFVNYDRSHQGPVTIHQSLGNSLNIPIIRLLNQMGGPKPLLDLYHQLHFRHLTKSARNYGLGLAIGSGEVTLLEAAEAFAMLANEGEYRASQLFLTKENPERGSKRVLSEKSVYLVSSILADNSARSTAFGSDSNLRLPFPCAVKTGTSTDFRDNWCIGYTKKYTVAVWAGNLDNSPMKGISGVTGAGPVFKSIMLQLHINQKPEWMEKLDGIASVNIHPHTGKILRPTSPIYVRAIHTYAPIDNLPLASSPEDIAADGRILLDKRYKNWLLKNPSAPFTLSKQGQETHHLRIISPAHKSTYVLDPDLPHQGAILELRCSSNNEVTWESDTLEIQTSDGKQVAILKQGTHHVSVTDHFTQEQETIIFYVKKL